MEARATTAAIRQHPASVVATIVVICGLLLGGYRAINSASTADENPAEQDRRILVVEVTEAKLESSFDRGIEFVGRVEAARESELSFELTGLVTALLVEEGDSVAAGQLLGRLDTSKLDAQRSVLVARQAAANALLKELIAGPREEDLKAARAEVERLGHELKRVELSRDRVEELLKRAAASRDRYEADLYAAESTKSALAAAQAELEELENGTRAEKIDAQRAVVNEIEAEIASVDVDLQKSKLVAPFAGSIGDRMVDEGNVVAIGQPIVSLLELTRPELRVGVDSATAAALSIGDSIPVVATHAKASGTIKAIRQDVAGRTRTVDVLISLTRAGESDDQLASFRSGELATAMITRTVPADGLWLPMAALTEGTRGLWSVFVAKPVEQDQQNHKHYQIERRDVEVLHNETNRVFVRGAVGDGDLVVISGMHRLVPGLRVEIKAR